MQPNQQQTYKVSQFTGRGRGGKYQSKNIIDRNQNSSHAQNKFHEQNTLNLTLYYNMLEIFE